MLTGPGFDIGEILAVELEVGRIEGRRLLPPDWRLPACADSTPSNRMEPTGANLASTRTDHRRPPGSRGTGRDFLRRQYTD